MTDVRFELVRRIGVGGMGEVQLARMIHGNGPAQLVALKRIRGEFDDAALARKEFDREARVTQLLDHPNVVALRDYGYDELGPFLALEYVDGLSAKALLSWFLKLEDTLPMPAVLAIAADVSAALSYAHALRAPAAGIQRGVVHRDVAPDNVLIAREGVAKLSDFGIARIAGWTSYTRTGSAKGKLGFMAPELYEGADASVQSDLFALGATLFRLASGVPPFPGKNDAEVMRAVLMGEVPSLGSLRRDAPEPLVRFVGEALSRDPAARPQSVAPFAEAVAALLPESSRRGALAAAVKRALARAQAERTQIVRMPGDEETERRPAKATVNQRPLTATVLAELEPPARRRWPAVAAGTASALALVLAGVIGARQLGGEDVAPLPSGAVAPVRTRNEQSALRAGRAREEQSAVAPVRTRDEPSAVAAERARDMPESAPVAPPDDAPRALVEAPPAAVQPQRTGEERRREPLRAAPTAAATREGDGYLTVRTEPWTMVEVADRPLGSTPLYRVALAPGRHRVLLTNERLGVRAERYVEIKPGEVVKLDLSLTK